MRRKLLLAVIALTALAVSFLGTARPADAQRIWPLIGCDSLLQWPCPGPVLVSP